jgi:hypothetical protein
LGVYILKKPSQSGTLAPPPQPQTSTEGSAPEPSHDNEGAEHA